MAAVSDKVLAERARAIERCLIRRNGGDGGPITARALAIVCGLDRDHESNRRRIREAISYGREKLGMRICANGDGYWLAQGAMEWGDYQEAVKAGSVFKFVRLRRTQQAVTERFSGQGTLFAIW